MERIRIIQGADREEGLENALNEVAAIGTINMVIWKERPGYWVIWYTASGVVTTTPPPLTTTPPPVTTSPP